MVLTVLVRYKKSFKLIILILVGESNDERDVKFCGLSRNILKLGNEVSYPARAGYSVHSRVGRGNLVLGHSVPRFLPYSGGVAC